MVETCERLSRGFGHGVTHVNHEPDRAGHFRIDAAARRRITDVHRARGVQDRHGVESPFLLCAEHTETAGAITVHSVRDPTERAVFEGEGGGASRGY